MRPCDDLVGFADGELDAEPAAAFRTHLQTCETCQALLVEALQLTVRLGELAPCPDLVAKRRNDPERHDPR